MGVPLFRNREWEKAAAQIRCRDPRGISNPQRCGTRSRASAPLCECGNQQPRMSNDARPDRPLHRPGASSVSRHSGWWSAGRRSSNLLSLCDVLQAGAKQLGTPAMGNVSSAGVREARSSSGGRGVASLIVAFVKKSHGPRSENSARYLERDEAHVQVRCEVGLSKRESDGREACRTAARLNQADDTLSPVDRTAVLPLARSAGLAREVGGGLRGMAGAACERDIRIAVAGFGPEERNRFFPTWIRSGSDHTTQDGSLAHEPADARRIGGLATPVAVRHSVQQSGRLGFRLALHERQASVLAGATAEEAHQAHCTGGWLAEHRLAQLPAYRERLGQGSGSEAGGCENSAAARRHRDHLERLRRLGNGCEAADSAAAGGVRQRAGERSRRSEGGLSRREGLGRTYARICSVNLRDPYLTQVRFWDSLQATEKNGSSGRTRTYNPPVNSRMLCH